MPGECCTRDYDAQFNADEARRDLLSYRHDGPDGSTRRLIDALRREGVEGASLLDIGGGVGAIQLELLAAGAASSTNVEASAPFLDAARQEAESRGIGARTSYLHGDFVALADEVPEADIVTLNRVICCYPHAESLVARSVNRARRLYGVVYPRDRWWTRLALGAGNRLMALFGRHYPVYVHPTALVERIVARAGWSLRYRHEGLLWQTVVWGR